ncbi:Nucleolar protein 13 [Lecanicillium sp. MT-2017a]|nr:Nucleolar protein 13 [Lecanicillium sp. MT-2017a]
MTTQEENPTSPPEAEVAAAASKRKASVDEIEVDLAAPEPPSKRARRALKKGKSATAKPVDDHDKGDLEEDDEKETKAKSDKPARSEHGVWIGNLAFTVTPLELRQFLIDNSGEVITKESITRIKLPYVKTPGGRDKSEKPVNKGFAYVDFADISTKVAAIAMTETEFCGRKLLIKDSKSFEGRPAKEKEEPDAANGNGADTKANGPGGVQVDPNASRKIFVGNLGFKTSQDDVMRNFEKCGEIEWAKIATFEDSGKCKGFGWVKFKEPEAAAWAVKGFVKIKEEVETEEDFQEDGDSEDKKQQQRQYKTRKWWVNRLAGRPLKIELAEDDQARYKKRFGKDRPKDEGDSRRQGGRAERPSRPPPKATEDDIQTARLTGRVVEHTGTKMTFD